MYTYSERILSTHVQVYVWARIIKHNMRAFLHPAIRSLVSFRKYSSKGFAEKRARTTVLNKYIRAQKYVRIFHKGLRLYRGMFSCMCTCNVYANIRRVILVFGNFKIILRNYNLYIVTYRRGKNVF